MAHTVRAEVQSGEGLLGQRTEAGGQEGLYAQAEGRQSCLESEECSS